MTIQFSLFAPDYVAPVGGNVFLKMPKAGSPIKCVIVGTVATGWSYWTGDKKCIRSLTRFTSTPGIRNEPGKVERVKHYWCVPVYDYDSKAIRILEITQTGVQNFISEVAGGSDYRLNDLTCALKISATGSGEMVKYVPMIVPVRPEEQAAIIEAINVSDLLKEGVQAALDSMGGEQEVTSAVPYVAPPALDMM